MAARCNVCMSIDVYRCSYCNNFGCYTRGCDGSIYSHPDTCSQCNSTISTWDDTMIRVNKNPITSWLKSSSNKEEPSTSDLLISLSVVILLILAMFFH